MRWGSAETTTLRIHWRNSSDAVLGERLGTTPGAVRAKRAELGLFRKPPPGFVVQVTKWLPALDDLDSCTELLRKYGVEYAIAKSKNHRYALFRKHSGAMSTVPEPLRNTWVQHWLPDGKKSAD
jgi:hypothetical protein